MSEIRLVNTLVMLPLLSIVRATPIADRKAAISVPIHGVSQRRWMTANTAGKTRSRAIENESRLCGSSVVCTTATVEERMAMTMTYQRGVGAIC